MKRYDSCVIHRRVRLEPSGSAGSATADRTLGGIGPGALMAIAVDYGSGVPATADVTVKADNVNGATVFTRSNSATDLAASQVGAPGVNAARAALAATDTHGPGIFARDGFYVAVAQADPYVDETDIIYVDVWYKQTGYVKRTLYPVGADGSAVVTDTVRLSQAGLLLGVAIDFQNQPATADVTVKADDASGASALVSTNSATDLAATGIGTAGIDETGAATAATDSVAAGFPFKTGLYIDVAQGDGQTSGNEIIVVELWFE